MADITADVLDSVIARINDTVPTIANKIYFEPPQNVTFPFMKFGYTSTDLNIRGNNAAYTFTFSIFTQTTATSALQQGLAIAESLYNALHGHRLSLTSGFAFSTRWDGFAQAAPEGDGKTVQYIVRYKILTTN